MVIASLWDGVIHQVHGCQLTVMHHNVHPPSASSASLFPILGICMQASLAEQFGESGAFLAHVGGHFFHTVMHHLNVHPQAPSSSLTLLFSILEICIPV